MESFHTLLHLLVGQLFNLVPSVAKFLGVVHGVLSVVIQQTSSGAHGRTFARTSMTNVNSSHLLIDHVLHHELGVRAWPRLRHKV